MASIHEIKNAKKSRDTATLKQIFEIVQKFLNTNILTCPKIYGHVIWMSDWFNKFLQLFIDKIFLYIPWMGWATGKYSQACKLFLFLNKKAWLWLNLVTFKRRVSRELCSRCCWCFFFTIFHFKREGNTFKESKSEKGNLYLLGGHTRQHSKFTLMECCDSHLCFHAE